MKHEASGRFPDENVPAVNYLGHCAVIREALLALGAALVSTPARPKWGEAPAPEDSPGEKATQALARVHALLGKSETPAFLRRHVLCAGIADPAYTLRASALAISVHADIFGEPRHGSLMDFLKCISGSSDPAVLFTAREQTGGLCTAGVLEFAEEGFGNRIRLGGKALSYLLGRSFNQTMLLDPGQKKRIETARLTNAEDGSAPSGAESGRERRSPVRRRAAGAHFTARSLFGTIRKTVIGLDPAVKTVSTRLALHAGRARLIRDGKDPGTPNESILLVGPSGAGKTFLAEQAGLAAGLPFASISATDLTAEGYVGMSLEQAFRVLVRKAGDDPERARYGICFFDEWDKKASREGMTTRDIGGQAVQQEMLRYMEGCTTTVGGRRQPVSSGEKPVEFNSRGTFFFFAGAYTGLEAILRRQGRGAGTLGFGAPKAPGPAQDSGAYRDALVEFGMIPEFVNRLTGILLIPEPTRESLLQILKGERGLVANLNRHLAPVGLKVQLDAGASASLAAFGLESKAYSRGMKMVLQSLVEDAVFNGESGTRRFVSADVDCVLDRMNGNSGAAKADSAGGSRTAA